MIFTNKEEIISITSSWKGERFPDGRPKVADKYLDALKDMTLEQLWKEIYVKGYEHQFIAMQPLHPEFDSEGNVSRKLIGRAVTAMYAPTRPDYAADVMRIAEESGRSGTPNQWVIDSLVERDVIVIDMYDKIFKGTFIGGNLLTAIKTRTVSGGAVIWGGIRDMEQMMKVPDMQVYFRGIDPTPIREFMMLSMNSPVRLGEGLSSAICLPGDVVYGCSGGVLFIPPHVVEEVVDGAAKAQIKDIFGFEMISQNKFTTAQIDKNVWSVEMLDLLLDFIRNDERGEDFRSLDWSKEYHEAESGIDGGSAL